MKDAPEQAAPRRDRPGRSPKILILGAYGFIGSGVVRHLRSAGYDVAGLGRDRDTAQRAFPALEWSISDLAKLQKADHWHDILNGIDVVINCAGALQDGARDRLDIVHTGSIRALAEACAARQIAIVQISAIGASKSASTRFFRTKAAGDLAVRNSGARHWIIRPGLVIDRTVYGGTALLRMLAAIPLVQPLAMRDSPVQTVGLPDLAGAVEMAIRGDIPDGAVFDLVEEEPHNLSNVVSALRRWLGFSPARYHLNIPLGLARAIALFADLLGHLGWRSPMRSTALAAIEDGVTGDPLQWRSITNRSVRDLNRFLEETPALPADRLAARLSLLLPLTVATLFLFWFSSGVIGLMQIDEAASTLIRAGWSDGIASLSVICWSVVDIALAGLLLVRKHAVKACIAMAVVGGIYLVAGTVVTPELWADPLGPLVKIVPAIVLAIAGAAILVER